MSVCYAFWGFYRKKWIENKLPNFKWIEEIWPHFSELNSKLWSYRIFRWVFYEILPQWKSWRKRKTIIRGHQHLFHKPKHMQQCNLMNLGIPSRQWTLKKAIRLMEFWLATKCSLSSFSRIKKQRSLKRQFHYVNIKLGFRMTKIVFSVKSKIVCSVSITHGVLTLSQVPIKWQYLSPSRKILLDQFLILMIKKCYPKFFKKINLKSGKMYQFNTGFGYWFLRKTKS